MSTLHKQYENHLIKLTKNAAKCLMCNEVIESKHRHDFVTCSCKSLSVDGGLSYTKRVFRNVEEYKDMSEYRKLEKHEIDDLITLYTRDESKYTYSESFYKGAIAAFKYYRDLWYPDLTKP